MFVKDKMTVNPYTIKPDDSINDAFSAIKDNGFHQLPVVKNGKLVGMLTERELQNVSPSKATTLSIYELNYLLTKIKVSEAMMTNPVTIQEDEFLEKAAVIMRQHDLRALPVMKGDKLVGIITQSDIFDAFIDMMGARNSGARLALRVPNKPGVALDIVTVISRTGANILHMALNNGADFGELIFKFDRDNIDDIISELKAKGYEIITASN
jgi:acetoin utilization protein AcuB